MHFEALELDEGGVAKYGQICKFLRKILPTVRATEVPGRGRVLMMNDGRPRTFLRGLLRPRTFLRGLLRPRTFLRGLLRPRTFLRGLLRPRTFLRGLLRPFRVWGNVQH